MNFLGHAHVALAVGPTDPTFVLGVVLPDLASMAGVRLDHEKMPEEIGRGVSFHHQADASFHGDAAFVGGVAALRHDLTATGLPSGPARAIGHVGWELVLDGTLLGTPAESAFWEAIAIAGDAVDAVRRDHRDRWSAFVDRWESRGGLRYDDPTWVAERVHVMLARRPRLAFPAEDLPMVATVLRRHAPAITAQAEAVFGATAARVRPTT